MMEEYTNITLSKHYKIGQKIDLTRWYVASENISDLQDARKRLETIKDTTPQNADFIYAITETIKNGEISYTVYEKAIWRTNSNQSGKIRYISGEERESKKVSVKELENLLI